MSPTAWKRLKEVFEVALEHQGADRGAYLASVCEGDQSLRAEVERLLAGADQAGSFLEQSPAAPEPEDASDREDFQIGQAVSHYQITAKLGHGGMGTVYQAMDLQLRRPVALKVTRGRWLREVDPNRRFLQEARAASALNHPNICHIYEIGETEGVRFIAMEYVEGRTLEAVIAQGPLELSQVALLGAQMAAALEEAHAHGIIHRDVKPANLMIGPRGELKVLDFGLAKAVAGSGAAGLDTNEGTLTRTGLVMGTVRYMSPEQLLGQHLDHRSDIFSLGLVLYEIATGGPAFRGETQVETIDRILHGRPEPIEAWPALDRIVSKCLEKNRERRYQSAGAIAEELRQAGQKPGLKVKAIPLCLLAAACDRSARKITKRNRTVAAAMALTAAVALSLIAELGRWNTLRSDGGGRSIAVLPLDNLSRNNEQDYFADGTTDALISSLARIPALRVISRTSVMSYKGARQPLPDIARKLGVQTIAEGSVLRVGNRVRISIRLVDAPKDRPVWSGDYEGDLKDVLGLQQLSYIITPAPSWREVGK